jgi:thiol-disulfide isomerase/thioredoxin
MKKTSLISLAIVFVIGTLGLNVLFKPRPEEKNVEQLSEYMHNSYWWRGKYPPNIDIVLLDGTHFRLSEHVGKKIIILNFFTTWCGPCKEEMPELSAYYSKHSTDHLAFIGINVDEKPDLVKQFVSEVRPTFPVGIDNNGTFSDSLGIKSYPTTIVIGMDGKISLYEVGSIANAEVVFDPILKENLNKLQQHLVIDSTVYLRKLSHQPKPTAFDTDNTKTKITLSGDALKFAERMHCPSCSKSLVQCTCNFCDDVKAKLSTMDLKDKKDEQILKDLFLTGEKP